MANLATPNMPSSNLNATAAFYASLGFEVAYRDENWMILTGHGMTLEFFLAPGVDPATSAYGACLRLDDVDAFYAVIQAAGIEETDHGAPRSHSPRLEPSGLRIGALIDPDGNLLRLIQNTD
ncbi:MAG: hypothetical protein GXY39_00440 [Actinomycetales bacterium]|nr:hypothetical protein [Tetrasphaera sp.]NLW98151.1 hypothetical protein [Actinomycetales bacterium]